MKNIYLLSCIMLFINFLLPAQHLKKVTGKANKIAEIIQQTVPQPTVKNLTDINDDFESYADFSLTFAPWTTADVDQSATYGFETNTFPNMYSPMAFLVFNPGATTPAITDPDLQAHSGSKFAACFASTVPPNNDWLISPAITLGTNSSVSFWVKSFTDLYGLERYKVGVSTTNTNPGSFTIISGPNYLEAPVADWQQKILDLNSYNGQTVYIGIQCVSNDAFVFMVDDFVATTTVGQTTSLTGKVTDAFTGSPLPGATVNVGQLSAITDSNGDYLIENVPAGSLTAAFSSDVTQGEAPLAVNFFDQSTEGTNTVICSKLGYLTYSNNQVVIPPGTTFTLNISLSPTLTDAEMRFVLNWGATPSDLDSHLDTPSIEGATYHVYYSNQGNATAAPYAALDHDVTSGYGPETMTIYQMFDGSYKFYIYNYSGSPEITTSQAVVQIYNQNGLLQTVQVPTSGTGPYWYVCDVDGVTGQLIIRNTVQETSPGIGKFDMPAKEPVKSGNEIVSWLWNFGDGATSTQQNPSHTYNAAGTYNVTLTVNNGTTSDIETKNAYINVTGQTGSGILTGLVTDALNGSPIEGALVTVAGLTDVTDASGNYTIENIPAGILSSNFSASRTVGVAPLLIDFFDQSTENSNTVTCSKTDYSTYTNNQVIVPQGGSLTLNISLSPALSSGQMRFVLNWSSSPSDLDSHLLTPDIEGNTYHIFYGDKGNATTAPYASLDYDVTTGYGPETMTIYQKFTGTYQYFIYNYTGSPEIITSQAVVQIYNDNGLLQTLQIPTSGTGLYWYVCDINGTTGQISIRNVIQEAAPGSVKMSSPSKVPDENSMYQKTINSWSWNFGDGGTSNVQNPSYSYTSPGTYTVSLTVSNGISTDTETKTAYINVQGVGIEEKGIEDEIRLYPVPANESLSIESPVEINSIRITDLSGKVVFENTTTGNKITIDLPDLHKGVYLLYIETPIGNAVKKFTSN